MSLATRCSECGTIFRVVADQLKVSEGWVRCGRCDAVFNAFGGLFDLDREAPPNWPTADPPPRLVAATKNEVGLPSAPPAITSVDQRPEPALPVIAAIEPLAPQTPVAPAGSGHAAPLYALAQNARQSSPGHVDATADLQPAPRTSPVVADSAADGGPLEPVPAPEFLRRAERQARWQQPRMRLLLAASAVLLLAALALQITHHFRDLLATRFPSSREALTAWCARAACRIEPLRRIDDIQVENTGLSPLTGVDGFRLSVALRNRGALELAVPAVDLSLTDARGQLVARRALLPQDFRVATETLKPGAEAALQLAFTIGAAGVTGYTVGIFYP